ncbi:mdis1-interacting receptor like kinase 2 [Quercus suber]|uniref:Mdis1-interacting receptor like kinase 2 n=1 Tax=Quercus suber TaxID=58331 RepID=A0AAW0K9H3_QUESU
MTSLQLGKNQLNGNVPISLGNQLSGPIPQEIGNLMMLVVLQLDTNHFTGILPQNMSEWFTSKFYCKQQSSHRVRLERNQLFGNISEDFGIYRNLQYNDLSYNKFYVGKLPNEFGKLTILLALMLNGNQLFGNIPPELGSLTNLEYLDLSNNRFDKSIPINIGNLLKLNYLNMRNKKFSHDIPVQTIFLCK